MRPGGPIEPVPIQQWPGKDNCIANKMPSTLTYGAGIFRVHSWGFQCPSIEDMGPGMDTKESFKFFLDESRLKDRFPRPEEVKIDDVRTWFKHFFTNLHRHVRAHLTDSWQVNWNSTKI